MAVRTTDLRPGDVVRIVAPSSPFARDRFDAGVALLEAAGLRPRYEQDLFAASRFLAGDDARRHGELARALADEEAKAIWIARGGYGATRLLPQLDVDAVRRAGKWLVGFSDTTALHALWARAGVQSVHGANVTTLADWSAAARSELFAWLAGEASLRLAGRTLGSSARVRGPLTGGNLTVLAAMAGTSYRAPARGCIMLLEDIGERPYRLDRAITQLRQAGYFDGVAGMVIGQLTDCEERAESNGWSSLDVVADALVPLAVPVVGGLPVGHENSSRALPFGAMAELDGDAGTLTLPVSA